MKLCRKLNWLVALAIISGCSVEGDKDAGSLLIFSKSFDFDESDQGWTCGFADYPASPEDSVRFELKFAHTEGPDESILTKRSLMLSGNNVNRDLFMYLKTKVSHLKPRTDYVITFHVELAPSCNPLPAASSGSLVLKAGATATEPASVVRDGYYRVNLDKGNQASPGRDVVSLGNIRADINSNGYALVSLNNTMTNAPFVARTNEVGELWLMVGTDSNLEGYNTIYYRRINIVFSAS